jgi:hypothetical protein
VFSFERPFCPRQYALFDLTDRKPWPERVSTAEELVFAQGRFLQNLVREALGEIVYGDWTCENCQWVHAIQREPDECVHCGSAFLAYNEVRFTSTKSGVSCGVDILVKFPDARQLTVVEVKSIDKEEFKKLHAPLAAHRLRTAAYMQIIEDSHHPQAHMIDTTVGRVLYVSKGGYGQIMDDHTAWGFDGDSKFSPFKEYFVTRDDENTEFYLNRAGALQAFRATGIMPSGVCKTNLQREAKACPVCAQCFTTQYPPGMTVKVDK